MRRLLALAVLLISAPTLAQEQRGGYIGLGIGKIDYEDNYHFIDFSDSGSNVKFIGGFRFNETLAFEGYYGKSGSLSANRTGIRNFFDESGTLHGPTYDATFKPEFEVIEFRVLAHAKYMVFGAGFFMSDLTGSVTGSTPNGGPIRGSLKDEDNGYSIIIGAQFDVRNLGVRIEYEYFDVSSPADATIFGVGLNYRFGSGE